MINIKLVYVQLLIMFSMYSCLEPETNVTKLLDILECSSCSQLNSKKIIVSELSTLLIDSSMFSFNERGVNIEISDDSLFLNRNDSIQYFHDDNFRCLAKLGQTGKDELFIINGENVESNISIPHISDLVILKKEDFYFIIVSYQYRQEMIAILPVSNSKVSYISTSKEVSLMGVEKKFELLNFNLSSFVEYQFKFIDNEKPPSSIIHTERVHFFEHETMNIDNRLKDILLK